MSITLPWWSLAVLCIVVGVAGAAMLGRQKGDYDMVSPLVGAGVFLIGVAGALGIVLGHWLAP